MAPPVARNQVGRGHNLIRERFGAASDESKAGTEVEALNTNLK